MFGQKWDVHCIVSIYGQFTTLQITHLTNQMPVKYINTN